MVQNNIELNKRLLDEFRDISNTFSLVMAEFYFIITSSDLAKQTDVVMAAYHEIGGGHQPIYNKQMREKLMKNKKYPMSRPNYKGIDRKDINGKNDRFDIVYKQMMAKISDDEKRVYIHDIMTKQTDISASLKMYKHINGEAKGYVEQCVVKQTQTEKEKFLNLISTALDQRNKYIGHRTRETEETFTPAAFQKEVQSYLEIVSYLKKQTTDFEDMKDAFVQMCKDWNRRINLTPITNEQLKKEYPTTVNPIETVKITEFGKDIFGDCVYFHTIVEIKGLIQKFTDAFVLPFQKDEKQKPVENKIVFENALHTAEKTPVLAFMKTYENNTFNDKQMDEIADKTVVMADAKFWMSRFYQTFISHTLKDRLQKFSRKFVVDKGTRVEIYKVMKNLSGEEKPADIQNAKWAYNMMSMMHERGYLNYLGTEGVYYGSDESIIDLAKRHEDVTFSIFVNDNNLSELIQKNELKNILPIKYIHIQDKFIVPKMYYDYYQDSLISREDEEEIDVESHETPVEEVQQAEVENIQETVQVFTPAGKVPISNEYVVDDKNQRIQLKKELGKGGEGIVYSCDIPGKVVKIYHEKCLTEERFQKIHLMVKNQPHMKEVCWPEKMIYNENHEFVGYMMKDVGSYKEFAITVFKLDSKRVRENTMAGWDRLALVKLCLNMCYTLKKLHEKDIYVGDINPRNLMIVPNSFNNPKFMFVDCDSYQFKKYPCSVGTTPYTSPKLFKRYNKTPETLEFGKVMRTDDDEVYAFASFMFGILMLKASPFQGKGVTNVNDAMMQYNFAYRTKNSSGKDTIDGPQRMIWNNTPAYVKAKFEKVFADAGYVPLDDWIKVLFGYRKAMENGENTKEIEPVLYRDGTDAQGQPYNQYFDCAECGEHRNMPVRRYQNEEKYHQPHLCNRCYPTVNRLRKVTVNHQCCKCGRTFETNGYEQYRAIKMSDGRIRCKQCKTQRF